MKILHILLFLTSKGVAGDVDGEDGAGNIVTRNGLSVDNKPIKFGIDSWFKW